MLPSTGVSGQHVTKKPAAPRRSAGYIPSLDGWRAVAILWVLSGHAEIWSYGWFSTRPFHQGSHRGVQLFFALSGFLICTRLLKEEEIFGAISLRSFYTRRIFRIQPAAIAYLLTVALLCAFGFLAWDGAAMAASLLMIRNLWPPSNVPGYWQTVHFWSLSVEEHFYLLLPGFLVLCRRHRLSILFLAVIAFDIWNVFVFRHPSLQRFGYSIYISTDMTIGGILLGSVFALALRKDRLRSLAQRLLRPWVALLYTAILFAYPGLHISVLVQALLLTVYPVVIVATVLHPESLTSRFLELKPLRFIGPISFSPYLWQELFFYPFERPVPGSFRSHELLCIAATFACATASYYLIETPLVRVGHRLAKRFDRPATQRSDVASIPDQPPDVVPADDLTAPVVSVRHLET